MVEFSCSYFFDVFTLAMSFFNTILLRFQIEQCFLVFLTVCDTVFNNCHMTIKQDITIDIPHASM